MYSELNSITVTQFTVTQIQYSNNSMYSELNSITVTQFTVTPIQYSYNSILRTELNNSHTIHCNTNTVQ